MGYGIIESLNIESLLHVREAKAGEWIGHMLKMVWALSGCKQRCLDLGGIPLGRSAAKAVMRKAMEKK
jgi:hypothetical protein